MNLVELDRALRQLRLSGMAAVLETRLRQAQAEKMTPIDLVSALVADELRRRQDRLLDRRHKLARFRDPDRALESFDFDFNKKMNRALIYELATASFIARREDALFLGPPGTGKSHLAQAIGRAAIHQGYRVIYREAHTLLEELADATLAGTRKDYLAELAAVPLLIIDDLGMRKLPHTAAEDLLEVIMRRYERASTLLTSNLLCGAPHNRFNAERLVMRASLRETPPPVYFDEVVLRITEPAAKEAISLSVAMKRPDRSFGAIIASRASSFTDGSARVYISVVCMCACPSHSDTLRRSLVAWSTVRAQVCLRTCGDTRFVDREGQTLAAVSACFSRMYSNPDRFRASGPCPERRATHAAPRR
jgi:DNA replication protein DnaC